MSAAMAWFDGLSLEFQIGYALMVFTVFWGVPVVVTAARRVWTGAWLKEL